MDYETEMKLENYANLIDQLADELAGMDSDDMEREQTEAALEAYQLEYKALQKRA